MTFVSATTTESNLIKSSSDEARKIVNPMPLDVFQRIQSSHLQT